MTWLFIEPTDVWLFRDSRSFSAGEGHRAHSLFPPTAFTVQGAIRSHILGSSAVDWIEFKEQSSPAARELGESIGYPADPDGSPSLGEFSMAGPFLGRWADDQVMRYVPLPADVVKLKGEERYFTLQPVQGRSSESDWPHEGMFPLWPKQESDIERPEGSMWLSERALHNYLEGKAFAPLKDKELFGIESRFGIALDYGRRRPIRTMLYQVGFVRPEDGLGLLVQLQGATMPSSEGLMKLGGEAHGARYTALTPEQVVATGSRMQPARKIKLVFLTPTYFAGGWQPADGDWSPFFGGAAVRLVAAAVDRPQHIGGWDVAHHRPKIMRGFVPAGSVYYFESEEIVLPPQGPISEAPPGELLLGRLGFGQVLADTWDWLSVDHDNYSEEV